MSVVVWDGKTIAADRQGTCADMRIIEPKIIARHRHDGIVVCAWTGESAYGRELVNWYFEDAIPSAYPTYQRDKEEWCRLIVASTNRVLYFERSPYPFEVHDPYLAWGSGRDFAMGALAMGADAIKAVEITSLFSTSCGHGVDAYDIK